MLSALRVVSLIALSALLPQQLHAQTPTVEIDIVEMDPPEGYEIARDASLSVRLRYKSTVPIRFRFEGRLQGAAVAASKLNIAPTYPAGEGEAIAWNAYRTAGRLDEIVVTALDEKWQPLATVSRPVTIWIGDSAQVRQRAAWVAQLNAEQQALGQRRMDEKRGDDSSGFPPMSLLLAGVFAYFLLQPWTIARYDGGWRIAAFVPLVATVPLLLHAVVALAAGANLWPLLVLLLLPIATFYLLVLMGVRAFARAS